MKKLFAVLALASFVWLANPIQAKSTLITNDHTISSSLAAGNSVQRSLDFLYRPMKDYNRSLMPFWVGLKVSNSNFSWNFEGTPIDTETVDVTALIGMWPRGKKAGLGLHGYVGYGLSSIKNRSTGFANTTRFNSHLKIGMGFDWLILIKTISGSSMALIVDYSATVRYATVNFKKAQIIDDVWRFGPRFWF